MLVFDLTPDLAASEGHISDPVLGDIRLELKFEKALPTLTYAYCIWSLTILF